MNEHHFNKEGIYVSSTNKCICLREACEDYSYPEANEGAIELGVEETNVDSDPLALYLSTDSSRINR